MCFHLSPALCCVPSLRLSPETPGQMNTINLPFVCWEKLSAPPVVRLLPPAAFTFFHLAGGATIECGFLFFFFFVQFQGFLKFSICAALKNPTGFHSFKQNSDFQPPHIFFFPGCLSGDVAPFEALLLKNKNLQTAQTSALRTWRSKNI